MLCALSCYPLIAKGVSVCRGSFVELIESLTTNCQVVYVHSSVVVLFDTFPIASGTLSPEGNPGLCSLGFERRGIADTIASTVHWLLPLNAPITPFCERDADGCLREQSCLLMHTVSQYQDIRHVLYRILTLLMICPAIWWIKRGMPDC